MKITVQRKIAGSLVTIEIDEKEEKIAIAKAIVFTVQDYCNNKVNGENCGCTNIFWAQNKTKEGYIYIKRICTKCKAQSTLGVYQPEGTGYFWKPFEMWEGEGKKTE